MCHIWSYLRIIVLWSRLSQNRSAVQRRGQGRRDSPNTMEPDCKNAWQFSEDFFHLYYTRKRWLNQVNSEQTGGWTSMIRMAQRPLSARISFTRATTSSSVWWIRLSWAAVSLSVWNTSAAPCTEHLTSGFGDEYIISCLLHVQLLYIDFLAICALKWL